MKKINCWEHKKCGRESNGAKVHDLGVCPVATEKKVDRFNSGNNGGRTCWAVAGTFCGGVRQGTFADKLKNCMECDFYHIVRDEEGDNYVSSRQICKIMDI